MTESVSQRGRESRDKFEDDPSERSYKVFVICRGCLGAGLVAQLLFT